jgi:hypothetical protein
MTRLTPAQRAGFDADGYLAPIDAFTADEAAESRRRLDALLAPSGGRPDVRLRNSPHLLLRWMADLVRDPRVLDAVEDVLGPNLLILRTTLFVKPPRDHGYVAWHQDVAYWDLSGERVASAWIALTDSTLANGCVRVVPGSHRGPLLAHGFDGDRNNNLLRGQVADVVIPPERIACAGARRPALRITVASCTARPAARSAGLRAGLAVRCIGPDVRLRTAPERDARARRRPLRSLSSSAGAAL